MKKEAASAPELLLKVNIPLIAEKAPKGWTISLVDNPGFGESKKNIVQATSESWEASTAYIYLTSKDSVGKILETEVFAAFYEKGEKFGKFTCMCIGHKLLSSLKMETISIIIYSLHKACCINYIICYVASIDHKNNCNYTNSRSQKVSFTYSYNVRFTI